MIMTYSGASSGSHLQEVSRQIVEKVLTGAFNRIVQERIEDMPKSCVDTLEKKQADVIVRDVLLKACVQYLCELCNCPCEAPNGLIKYQVGSKFGSHVTEERTPAPNPVSSKPIAIAVDQGSRGASSTAAERSQNQNFQSEPANHSDLEPDEVTGLRDIVLAGQPHQLNMDLIGSYLNVFSHAGYHITQPSSFSTAGEGSSQPPGGDKTALIVISASRLPRKSTRNYENIMSSLLLYVMHRVDSLSVDNYSLAYIHGGSSGSQAPPFKWLRQAYHMIDNKVKKNLVRLYLVHPTLWVKTVVFFCKPLLSSKFRSKLEFVPSIRDLSQKVPTEYLNLSEDIIEYERKNFH